MFTHVYTYHSETTLSRRKFGLLASSALAALALGSASAANLQPSPVSHDFDAMLTESIDAGVPGVAMAISRKGELLYSGAAGVSNLETRVPVRPTDRFRIYSISKAFAALVVLQLVDEGRISLDDTTTTWLDTDAVLAIPNIDRVTIRQLLNHTGGVYDFADDADSPFWEDAFLGSNTDWAKVWTIDELLAYAAAKNHDPYFAPGEGHHYSNTDYLLLGLIVERVTGNRYGDELKRRVLDPIGLENSFFAEGGDLPTATITGYQFLDGQPVDISIINLSWIWAAGALVSTTEDLLTFAEALFSGALLSDESFGEMFTFVATEHPSYGEGMGIYRIETDFGILTGMDGGGPGFNSTMMRHEESGITVAILGNAAPDLGVNALRDRVFSEMTAISN